MNQHTVFASAILAVAIVAAAWLLKPIPPQQQCWRLTSNANGEANSIIIFDQCAGEGWWFFKSKFVRFFDADERTRPRLSE